MEFLSREICSSNIDLKRESIVVCKAEAVDREIIDVGDDVHSGFNQ